MTRLIAFSTSLFFLCLTINAQSDRTFVSAKGIDSPTCSSFTDPCRSFNVAIPKTNSGGEVIALDSGIYDAFNIAVPMSLTIAAAPGAHVELTDTGSGDRISINTGSGGGTVTLRNLILIRRGTGTGNGINLVSGGNLQIENCVIDGFRFGINVSVTASAQVSISNTVVRNSTADGLAVFAATGSRAKVSVDKSRFENTSGADSSSVLGHGIYVSDRSKVTVRNSVATGNSGAGFVAEGDGADIAVDNCEVSNNKNGIVASNNFGTGGGAAAVSNTVVTYNSGTGFLQSSTAVFNSFGNNVVRRNGTNTGGTISVVTGT